MIHAYDEIYLNDAKNSLSWMLDHQINDCGMDPDQAADCFIRSGYAGYFEEGNPSRSFMKYWEKKNGKLMQGR